MENKLTDKEIKKALECCCKNNNCEGCPLDYLTFSSQCASELAIKSLDLINRLEAENEKWQAECKRVCAERDARICTAKFYKSEARKEFAKLLIDKSKNGVIHISDIPDFVKEMEGE